MEKIIRVRLFTWFEEVDSPVHNGETVLVERIAHLGQKVDITNDAFIKRGEELDAFYTDEEAAQIEAGTYAGPDSEFLLRARAGIRPVSQIEPLEDEGPQTQNMSAEELAEYIKENRLGVGKTVALAGEDTESIERVLDAENIATDNDPRPGVVSALDRKLQRAAQGQSDSGGNDQ